MNATEQLLERSAGDPYDSLEPGHQPSGHTAADLEQELDHVQTQLNASLQVRNLCCRMI